MRLKRICLMDVFLYIQFLNTRLLFLVSLFLILHLMNRINIICSLHPESSHCFCVFWGVSLSSIGMREAAAPTGSLT